MSGLEENEDRLNDILDMIGNMAALDFSKVLTTSGKNDMVDAIALGLNMLSEELNSQVVARTKLDEINQKLEKFAHTTAHDLKSPLNNASALYEMLKESIQAGQAEDALLLLGKLELTNQKMRKLVEGTLEYSKGYSLDLSAEKVDLNEVMNEIIETDNIKAHADVHISARLPVVLFNKTASVQVIRNLVDNSIKYSDKERCMINVLSTELMDSYQITFSDNGPGIPADCHEKVFELYTRIDANEDATSVGIGLATVKNVIESAGGRIWLDSAPGKGAAFIFTLRKPVDEI